MKDLFLIYAADQNWGIGKNNDLLVAIPEDLKDRFKALTLCKTVVMGKKTLLSLPGQKGLPKRTNYVLTRQKELEAVNAITVNSIPELFEAIEASETDIMVIGGGEIYRQLRPYCKGAYVTKILKTFDADTFVDNLDNDPDWEIVKESEVMESVIGVSFKYVDYINNNPIRL